MNTFLFAPRSPRPVAAMRIGLGAVFLYHAVAHAPFAVETYSSAGVPWRLFRETFAPPVLAAGPTVLLHGLLIFALLASMLGFLTRVSLLLAAFLLGWFSLLDFLGTLTKYTAIGLHLLVLLSLANSGAVWSIDAWVLARRKRAVPLTPAWPQRLMQLLVCSVYLGAAVTKLRLQQFATGDLLAFSLLDDRWGGRAPGHWIAVSPQLVILASFSTVLFEFAFPMLVWVKRMRRPMLLVAAAFHVSLAVTMSLAIFTPVMLCALLAFVDESDLRALRIPAIGNPQATTARVQPVVRWLVLAAAWGVLAAGTSAASWAVHRQFDPYGAFAEEPAPLELQEVPREEAAEMIEPAPFLAEDYVHRVEVGHRASNFRTFGGSEVFHYGDVVNVMVGFVRRHPLLEVEYVLYHPRSNLEYREPARVTPETDYSHVAFNVADAFPPGEYDLEVYVRDATFSTGEPRLAFHTSFEVVEAAD